MGLFRVEAIPPGLNRKRRETRAADELIGLCRGMLADGSVNLAEARFLLDWISRNQDVHDDPVAATLYQRVADAMTDGVLDSQEEADLLAALHGYVGGEAQHPVVASESTWLPLDDPAPPIAFRGNVFVVTGTFLFGARRLVTDEIEKRGGSVADTVRASKTILIIGGTVSRDWLHSSYGRKIMVAADYREKGYQVAIVSETHWVAHL